MADQDGRPSFVIVHGAWHDPSHFDPVTTLLHDAGFTVKAPKLPSVRNHGPDTGNALRDDIATIADAVRNITKTGQNVVLVMHSYAGFCGSDAAAIVCEEQKSSPHENTHGRILRLVYLAAFVPDKGISLFETFDPTTPQGPPLNVSAEGLLSWHNPLLGFRSPIDSFYHTTPLPIAEAAASKLELLAFSTHTASTRYAGWRDYGLPITYIACRQDRALPAGLQQQFIDKITAARVKDFHSVWLEESDHSPFLHSPETVARLLREAAGSV